MDREQKAQGAEELKLSLPKRETPNPLPVGTGEPPAPALASTVKPGATPMRLEAPKRRDSGERPTVIPAPTPSPKATPDHLPAPEPKLKAPPLAPTPAPEGTAAPVVPTPASAASAPSTPAESAPSTTAPSAPAASAAPASASAPPSAPAGTAGPPPPGAPPVPPPPSSPAPKEHVPWLSIYSWLRFLWVVFKVAVIFVVIAASLAFGAVMGVTVYRTYFAVPDEIEVPAIQGKDFATANEILKDLGLRLRIEEGRHATKFPNRIIISQEPKPGQVVRRDREILAVVSLGPELYKVPDLQGLSLREVEKALSNNKLSLGKVTYTAKDSNRPDIVLNQKPQPRTLVHKGTKVNIQVNRGTGELKVVVPNCQGRHLAKAIPTLQKAGLELGRVVWTYSEKPAGTVLSQSPPSGADVMRDSEVECEVSTGPTQERLLARRKLELFLPAGDQYQKVRVMLLTSAGEEEIYRATHVAGDALALWVMGNPHDDIEIYVNDKLFMRDKL